MAIKVSRTDVWSAIIDDRPGGVADKLEVLSTAGANLEWVFARRRADQPGTGILFAGPIKGAKVIRAAQGAGFAKSDQMYGVKVEGDDKAGLGAKITRGLGDAGISIRGISAQVVGRKFVSNLALDSADDAVKAVALLRKLK